MMLRSNIMAGAHRPATEQRRSRRRSSGPSPSRGWRLRSPI